MSTKKKVISLSIDPDLHQQAKVILTKKGTNLSAFVNDALLKFIEGNPGDGMTDKEIHFHREVNSMIKRSLDGQPESKYPGIRERCEIRIKTKMNEEVAK